MKAWLCSIVLGMSCDSGSTYTLYRNSAIDQTMRIHVATFNAQEEAAYNQENCGVGAQLFSAQPGVATRFWCEKGLFKN